jgi:G3E family GTPase
VADAALAHVYRFAGVVTTVDAVNAVGTLARHEEARRQVGFADVLLITKMDLVSGAAVDALHDELQRSNPAAARHIAIGGRVDPEALLDVDAQSITRLTQLKAQHAHYHHDHSIAAHCFIFDEPVRGEDLGHWLALLTAMRGERLLRFKGLVHIAEHPDAPLVVHGAQHVIHPPARLPHWPSPDRRTRLVFITQGLPRADIERTLRKYAGARLTTASA